MAEIRSEHASPLKGNASRVDPSVYIPPAVRAAAERAEQLQREAGVTNMPEAPSPQEPPQQPPQQPPQPQEPPQQPQPQQPPGSPPVPPPGAEPPKGAQPGAPEPRFEDPRDLPEESWKLRYENEHGRVERARRDNDALSKRVTDLEQMLADLQVMNYEAAPPKERTFTSSLTDKEREEWGEVLPVIEKQAKDLIAPLEAELQDKIRQIDEQLKSIGTATAVRTKGEFLASLDGNPQIGLASGENCWRVLNDDTADGGFVHWLQGYDRRSGRRMHEMLKDAYTLNDAPRFAAFFEDFLRETGRLAPPSSRPAAADNSAPANGLERFAAPGKPKNAGTVPTVPAEPETFTSGDIARFYQDKQLGRWKGREAEMEAYEQRMHAAVRENRVRPGLPQP